MRTPLLLIFTILCINIGYSQSINSAGNSNQLTNHHIKWSVGDVFASANVNIVSGSIAEFISIVEQEDDVVAANENFNNFELSVYPNPAYAHINISFNETINEAELQLINSSGKVLKTINKNQFNNSIQFSVNELESGIYFLIISNKNYNTKTFKLLKK